MCPHLGCPAGGRGGSRRIRGLVSVPDCELVRGQKREGVGVVGRVQTSPDGSWALLEFLTTAGEPLGLQDPEVPLGRSRPGLSSGLAPEPGAGGCWTGFSGVRGCLHHHPGWRLGEAGTWYFSHSPEACFSA